MIENFIYVNDFVKSVVEYSCYGVLLYNSYLALKDLKNPSNKICKHEELNSVKGNGIQISKNIRLSEKQSNEHILAICPSGWGKSRSLVMPNISNLNSEKCSIVVSDPVGEIKNNVKSCKQQYIFNPMSDESIGYDPLKNCKNESDVEKLAKIILINGVDEKSLNDMSDWIDMSILLLSSFLIVTWKQNKNTFTSAIKFICTKDIFPKEKRTEITNENVTVSDIIFSSGIKSAIDKLLSFKKSVGATQTFSCICTIMNTCLKCFLDENVIKMCNKKSIDLSTIRKNESIIYIQIPEKYSYYFKALTTTFYSQLFDLLIDRHGLQVYCILDEFCNIGKFDNIQTLLSTLRKHNVSIFALIQALNQLDYLYPNECLTDLFKTILVGCGLKDSCNYISELIGYDENNKLLMPVDKIRRLKEDETLIICYNKRAVIDKNHSLII